MMDEVYVFDKNLDMVGLVDTYKSLIWTNRYREAGDCELYLPATGEALDLLRIGYYLLRADDDMVCRIDRIQLDTGTENGNYLTVTGTDIKGMLDQRIIWGTMTCNGNLETFIRKMVDSCMISPTIAERKFLKTNGQALFSLGSAAGLTERNTEQTSYRNVGEKIRDYCEKNGWGYRVVLKSSTFAFELFKGSDRSAEVIFSDDFENLSTTQYSEDWTNLGNVALTAGEGEGANRIRTVSGDFDGVDRYEIYVDAKDLSKDVTFEELKTSYPMSSTGGYITTESGQAVYKMHRLEVQVIDDAHLASLQSLFPSGTVITVEGQRYYRITEIVIADLPSSSPQDSDSVTLRDVIYTCYLITKGYENLAAFGAVTTFEGTIAPNSTFVYKQDYFLGDIVAVENSFGISVDARITEIIEVKDENGYSVEPTFEYIQEA